MKWGVGREEGVSAPPLTKLIIDHIGQKQQKPFLRLSAGLNVSKSPPHPVVPG